MDAEAAGPIVVVTAMPLSDAARADLSHRLGEGYAVVDIKQAPESVNVLLTPVVSGQALAALRGSFPQARILFTELYDEQHGISFEGPLSRAIAHGPDGYFVAHELDALAPVVQTEAHLQLTGSTRRTPPRLAIAPARESPGGTAPAAPMPPEAGAPPGVGVLWLDGDSDDPAGTRLDLTSLDRVVEQIIGTTAPRDDLLWAALAAECILRRLPDAGDDPLLVDLTGLAPAVRAEVKIRVASEGVRHAPWPA